METKTVIYTCSECGEPIYEEDPYYTTHDGKHICQSCFDEVYAVCHDCGEIYPMDELTTTHYGTNVCRRCLEGYYYCDCCEEYVYPDDYDSDEDFECCIWCSNNRIIASYHSHHDNWSYFGDSDKMLGIELEVENCEDDIDNDEMADIINGITNGHLYFEHDGSLDNGFEIISHPHTPDEFYDIDWKRVLSKLIDNGYRSHDAETCGLHIHVSRDWFGPDLGKQEINIAKLLLCYSYNWKFFLKCSRRTQEQADRWAAEYCTTDMNQAKENVKKGCSRYLAINLLNEETVEFRLGRGTLRYESFMAWIDLHLALVRNVLNISEDKATDLTLWLDGISDETRQYIKEKTNSDITEGGEM